MMEESELMSHSEKGVNDHRGTPKNVKNVKKTENGPKIGQQTEPDMVIDEEGRTKLMFDRPTPALQKEWIGDPRLPAELNELMATMWAHKHPNKRMEVEEYREAMPSEVSDPVDFLTYLRPHERSKKPQRTPQFRLPTVDESEQALKALAKRYSEPGLRSPNKSNTKGKDRKVGLEEKDIPRLRQQWNDEFQDILQGTKEELLPL